jgi:hypothetical protein
MKLGEPNSAVMFFKANNGYNVILQYLHTNRSNILHPSQTPFIISNQVDKKKELATILSVSERTIRNWLSRIDKDAKEARDKRIFERWMACHSQEEIAGARYFFLDIRPSWNEVVNPRGAVADENTPERRNRHVTETEQDP